MVEEYTEGIFQPTEGPLPAKPAGADEAVRLKLRARASTDLYFMAKAVLGYSKLKPDVHVPMCRFLEKTRGKYNRRMLEHPRSTFKTTVETISQTIQDVCNDPNLRILIIAGTGTNAERFMYEIRQHFQRNEFLRWLYPEVLPENFNSQRWNNSELELRRTALWREPTIDAIGAGGMVESRHYDIIRADDLIGEKQLKSDIEMAKLTDWADGLESLLINIDCLIDVACTRWKAGDTYEHLENAWGGRMKQRKIGPHAWARGIMVKYWREAIENGKSIFEEQIPLSFLIRFRNTNPERYAAWYANNPKASGLTTFRPEWVKFYHWTQDGMIELRDEVGTVMERFSPFDCERIALFDPAVAERKRSARNAMLVVGKYKQYRIILETHIGHYPPDESIDYIFEVDKKWSPGIFSIEGVAYQRSIKYWIRERAEREGLPEPAIEEYVPESDMNKDERIKGLQPLYRAGLVWMDESMMELRDELESWPRSIFRDALDALAQMNRYWEGDFVVESNEEHRHRVWQEAGIATGTYIEERDELEDWDEDRFLRSLGTTGYGIRRLPAE